MSGLRLDIVTLFPDILDLHADSANAAVLQVRAQWEGIDAQVIPVALGERLPSRRPDLLVVGSGADEDIPLAARELARCGSALIDWVYSGTSLLAIGTGWYLLSQRVELGDGSFEVGVGVFTGKARLLPRRASDDLVLSTGSGVLIGYENHSTAYDYGVGEQPWGSVLHGVGNGDGWEGVTRVGALGTHLHGPVLAKNPELADSLLGEAMERRHGVGFQPSSEEIRRADGLARGARERILASVKLRGVGLPR